MQSPQPVPEKSRRRMKLGELLVKAGLIDERALQEALKLQKVQDVKLGQALIDMGFADDVDIANALAGQLNIPFLRLEKARIEPEVLELVSREIAEKYTLIPLKKTPKGLVVAIANPLEFQAIDDIRFMTHMPVFIVVSPSRDIRNAIKGRYAKKAENTDPVNDEPDLPMEIVQRKAPSEKPDRDLMNLAELPPVIRFTNAILADAIRLNASDIHVEPHRTKLIVRCRIDGIMKETMRTDKHVHASLVSRLKVISGLDISIRMKPQDGKTQVRYDGKQYDLRISTIPTSYGEKVTIRILNPDSAQLHPKDLGFSEENLASLLRIVHSPQGIFLVTGPTGSGKSSTLYACLNRLNTPKVNIITVEDPVEYDVEGINQVQISPLAGITFAAGLRSILRQDPDIVMVGEIRDSETAHISFEAAQTGHLVLSTLHTNDAPGAVTRLMDLSVADYQISAALLAVLAQRLVRRIHHKCKSKDTPSEKMMALLKAASPAADFSSFMKGDGCDGCYRTGYRGRLGIFELLTITPTLRLTISNGVSTQAILDAAIGEGFRTLFDDGLKKAREGQTTLEEILRVAPPPQDAGAFTQPRPAGKGMAVKESISPADVWMDTIEHVNRPAARQKGEKTKGGGRSGVLIVEDSKTTRKLLRNAFATMNIAVWEAENGKIGLKTAMEKRPGLVVTDYKMPVMDGIELIRSLRAEPVTADIPVIMLTAVDEDESEIAGFNAGADDYLTKPVNPKRLLARAQRYLHFQKTVLVVDDCPDTRKLICRFLQQTDCSTETAANGAEALARIRAYPPDIVITDCRMPEMDGVQLLRELKNDNATKEIPVVVMTAEDDVEFEVKLLRAGADDLVSKPLNAGKMLARVTRLLEKSESVMNGRHVQ